VNWTVFLNPYVIIHTKLHMRATWKRPTNDTTWHNERARLPRERRAPDAASSTAMRGNYMTKSKIVRVRPHLRRPPRPAQEVVLFPRPKFVIDEETVGTVSTPNLFLSYPEVPVSIITEIESARTPEQVEQIINKNQFAIARACNRWYTGKQGSFLECNLAAELMAAAMARKGIHARFVEGSNASGEGHEYLRINGKTYDPTGQGVLE
jgi:hypothetical protein